MIRTTLTAVPQRGSVLAANATIFSLVTFAVSAVPTFAEFFASQAIGLRDDQRGTEQRPGDPLNVRLPALTLSELRTFRDRRLRGAARIRFLSR